jgi:hypothetical protein
MSSRAAGFFLSSTTVVLVAASAVGSGCSDDANPGVGGVDAGARDATQRDAPPAEEAGTAPSRATCIEACSTTYAGAQIKDEAIATCWSTQCPGHCTPGGADADADTGFDVGLDAGACQNPVSTGDPACDLCTRARCCAAWDGCFDDDDCARYTACVQDCPAQ